MKYYKFLPFIILSAIQVYLLDKGFYAISADESGHTLDAYKFLHGGSLFSIWLPFTKLLYAGLFLIWDNLFWVPRIASMITSYFLVYFLMKLSKEPLLAGIFAATFVGVSVFSVLPLTEIYFFTFLTASFYLWKKKSNWVYLTIILMTMTRFEGWLFALIFLVIQRDKNSLLFIIFPIFWVILSYFETGSMMGFIISVSGRIKEVHLEQTVLYNFILINVCTFFFLGFFEMKKFSVIYFSSLIIWILATQITGALPSHNFWRVGLIWNILLIPLVAEFAMRHRYIIPIILLLALFQLKNHTQKSFIDKQDFETAEEIKKLSGTFLMSPNGWGFTSLGVLSNKPDSFIISNKYIKADHIIIPGGNKWLIK